MSTKEFFAKYPEMKSLFEKEINSHATLVNQALTKAYEEQARIAQRINDLQRSAEQIAEQLICNDEETHDFASDNVSIMGSRFEEVCKHCGFTNRV